MKPVTSLIWAISILLCICAGGWASSVNVHVSSPDEKPGTGFSKDSSCHQYDSPGGFSSLSKAEVDGIIEPYIKNGTFVGVAVAVIDEHGYDVWGYGTTDSNSTHVPDENTVFEIGSVSKTFSGVLLADALLQGTMTLTDPLSRYLPQDQKVPDFEGRTITIRDLATHTSGLPPVPDKFFIVANNSSNKSPAESYEDIVSLYETMDADEVYRWLGNYTLTSPVGKNWSYCNVGAAILGQIIAHTHGMTFRDLVQERISKPLGMDSTDTILTPDLAARFATGYRAYGGEFGKARLIQFNDFWDPNGGIYSTPHDMIRYTAAAMGLCPSALSDACTVSELPFALREERPQLLLQGLLWEIMPLPDGTALIMKTGETNAFQTQMIFSRPYKKGVLVFINTAYLGEGPRISSIALSIMEKMLPDRSFSSVNG